MATAKCGEFFEIRIVCHVSLEKALLLFSQRKLERVYQSKAAGSQWYVLMPECLLKRFRLLCIVYTWLFKILLGVRFEKNERYLQQKMACCQRAPAWIWAANPKRWHLYEIGSLKFGTVFLAAGHRDAFNCTTEPTSKRFCWSAKPCGPPQRVRRMLEHRKLLKPFWWKPCVLQRTWETVLNVVELPQ